MQISRSAQWARRWPAGLGAQVPAWMTAPAAFGATEAGSPQLAAARQPAGRSAFAAALVTPQLATGSLDSAAGAVLVVVLLVGLAVIIVRTREPRATARGAASVPRQGQPPPTGPGQRPSPHTIPATTGARSVAPAATGSPDPARTPNAPTRRVAGY